MTGACCGPAAGPQPEQEALGAGSPAFGDEEEEKDLNKALGVERFEEILNDAHPRNAEEAGRSYGEEDFEYHRQSSHHIHHPLSTHLPPDARRKKGIPKKGKKKARRASVPGETPTIEEAEEDEDDACDTETERSAEELRQPGPAEAVQFFLQEDEVTDRRAEEPAAPAALPGSPPEPRGAVTPKEAQASSPDAEQGALGEGAAAEAGSPGRPAPKSQPGHRSYNLHERRCIGSMTAAEQDRYQRMPTDESEAQTLASADLDYMKSHRFEDVPGVRRHLVRKSAKAQMVHVSKGHKEPSTRQRKQDRQPHEVFVELNELVVDKNQELQWKETARWIKFEEDVEEETDRWGKPHVASLSFRSLLELRKTLAHGAVLLDLDQKTLPGVAHQVVEQMVITDQIRAEDRANVLRALLLKHSHPSDEKEFSFPRNISAGSLGSLLVHHHSTNHVAEGSEPAVTEPLIAGHAGEHDTRVDVEREREVVTPTPPAGITRSKSKHELKLLEKIPDNAEATVVLVGCVEFLDQPTMAFVRLQEAVELDAVLEVPVPVRFLFVLLGPSSTHMDYHEIGRSISTLMSDKQFHEAAYLADDRHDLLNAINEFLDCSVVLPPSEVQGEELLRSVAHFQREMLKKRMEQERRLLLEPKSPEEKGLKVVEDEAEEEDDPLRRTGRPFGGLIRDVRRRYPQYLSDFRDALDPQCIAAVIFIYFAALSPAITFGGLLGEWGCGGLQGLGQSRGAWGRAGGMGEPVLCQPSALMPRLIISKKERMLQKGSGFHLDLLLIVAMGGFFALFGLPWLAAATVRSVTHANALTVMSKAVAPGDKPKIQEVKEQRVTGLLVAVLVGLSIVIGDLLRQIPLAVLFGIFLYMGVTSLNGIQFYERLQLLLMPPKHHPDVTYVKKVRTLRMHLFTGLQLACLAVLWAVMSTVASLAFPFILILTVPLRMCLLSRIFTDREMKCLDAAEAEPILDEREGVDEYNEMPMPV
uniref:Anion exchange protein 2 n=1 Tax=Cyanoderma ruficeps TaxID=181631 RepID=A0A8C3NZU6_9PASS